jgi:hypothetical protein
VRRPHPQLFVSLVAIALLAGTTACHAQKPTPPDPQEVATNQARADALRAEPILHDTVGPPVVHPGGVISEKLGWSRTEVDARLFQDIAGSDGEGPPPAQVEQKVTAALAVMRQAGWTAHWAMCLPPPPHPEDELSPSASGTPAPTPTPTPTPTPIRAPATSANASPPPPIPIDPPRADGYEWVIYAYKSANSVSYWAMLYGALLHSGDAWLDIVLRAPAARDPADLIGQPTAIAAGKSCVDDGKNTTTVEQSGTPTAMRDWWPFPAQSHSPNPNKV